MDSLGKVPKADPNLGEYSDNEEGEDSGSEDPFESLDFRRSLLFSWWC